MRAHDAAKPFPISTIPEERQPGLNMVRLSVALVLLATVGLGWWWAVSSGAERDPVAEGAHRVVVVGVDGAVMDDRVVWARETPLDAVRQAALEGNYTVEVEEQPWIGAGCTAAYVIGIAGLRESSTGGWNYYVRSPGEGWEWKSAGAACFELDPGDDVEWCWVEDDVCRHHAP
jgi:hypothetical protein